jgi:RNA polymerase sigma-70 factor (ECF subfamily)
MSGAKVMPWVMAIAHHALVDEARSRRAASCVLATGELPAVPAEGDLLGELTRREELERRQAAVHRGLAELHPSHREALLLTKGAGLTIREAAEALGTTPSAVKLRVHRAYLSLRVTLGHHARQPA